MNIIKKTIIKNGLIAFFPAAILLVTGLIVIIFKTLIIIHLPEADLSRFINHYFTENLKKAVSFQEASIGFNGRIMIKNIQVSSTGDFNDSLDLIRADGLQINLSLISIFRKSPVVTSMRFLRPEMTINKKTDKSFIDTFLAVFNPVDLPEEMSRSGLFLEIQEGILNYHEFFPHGKEMIRAEKIYGAVKFRNNELYAEFDSLIASKGESKKSGSLNINGLFKGYKNFIIKIESSDIDLSYLNPYIEEHFDFNQQISGTGAMTADLQRADDVIHCITKIDTGQLSVKSLKVETGGFVNDLDLKLKGDFAYDMSSKFFTKAGIHLDADMLDIYFEFENFGDIVKIKTGSGGIDLRQLSEKVSPVPGWSFEGSGDYSLNIVYDSVKKSPSVINGEIRLRNFGLASVENAAMEKILQKTNLNLKIDDKSANWVVQGLGGRGDFDIDINSVITSWTPLKSETSASIKSKDFDGRFFSAMLSRFGRILHRMAAESKTYGMDDEPFLQKPAGVFIQSNNFDLRFTAEKLLLPGRGYFSKPGVLMKMNRGLFNIDEFSLDGYGGTYKLKAQALFNTNIPNIKIEGSISELNIKPLFSDMKYDGDMKGLLTADFSYECSGYKFSKFFDNSKGEMKLMISDFSAENTLFQKKIQQFFVDNNIESSVVSLGNNPFFVNALLLGENWYFSGFNLTGSGLSLHGNGRYRYDSGSDISYNIATGRSGGKVSSLIMKLTGELSRPCFILMNGKNAEAELCFNP